MDLFWSGLRRKASEHTWNERRSQFSKIHETPMGDIETRESEKIRFNEKSRSQAQIFSVLGQGRDKIKTL